MFSYKSSYTPPSFNKKRTLSVAEVPETSTFYPIFTSFQVGEVCNISNKY